MNRLHRNTTVRGNPLPADQTPPNSTPTPGGAAPAGRVAVNSDAAQPPAHSRSLGLFRRAPQNPETQARPARETGAAPRSTLRAFREGVRGEQRPQAQAQDRAVGTQPSNATPATDWSTIPIPYLHPVPRSGENSAAQSNSSVPQNRASEPTRAAVSMGAAPPVPLPAHSAPAASLPVAALARGNLQGARATGLRTPTSLTARTAPTPRAPAPLTAQTLSVATDRVSSRIEWNQVHGLSDLDDENAALRLPEIQRDLENLTRCTVQSLHPRVVLAALIANNDPDNLINLLADAPRLALRFPEYDLTASGAVLASIETLDAAQIELVNLVNAENSTSISTEHAFSINEILVQLTYGTAVTTPPRLLNAALLARNDPLALLRHLRDRLDEGNTPGSLPPPAPTAAALTQQGASVGNRAGGATPGRQASAAASNRATPGLAPTNAAPPAAAIKESITSTESEWRQLTAETLQIASAGLLGLHESEDEDFRELAGHSAVQLQRLIADLHGKPASALHPNMVRAAVLAIDKPQVLIKFLADMPGTATVTSKYPWSQSAADATLVSRATHAQARANLSNFTNPPGGIPMSRQHAQLISEQLDQLASGTVLTTPVNVLIAASRAQNDPLALLTHLRTVLTGGELPRASPALDANTSQPATGSARRRFPAFSSPPN